VRQLKITPDRLTTRTENISRYFTEVSSFPMLSPDEEFEIGRLSQQGDPAAIEKLISANLRFVVSVAKQYTNPEVSLEDLICQGNIGLCDAARQFDPTRGFRFISFAVWHIRKEILVYLNSDTRTVRVPQNILTDLSKIRKANEQILQEEERLGTFEEIEEKISQFSAKEITANQIQRILHADTKGVAIDSSISEDVLSPIDWLSSDITTTRLTDESDLTETVRVALSKLTLIQRDVVCRKMGLNGGDPEHFSIIARRYEKTTEWARLVYVKALRTMQIKMRSNREIRNVLSDQDSWSK